MRHEHGVVGVIATYSLARFNCPYTPYILNLSLSAGASLVIILIVIFALIVQKNIVRGLTLGAIK